MIKKKFIIKQKNIINNKNSPQNWLQSENLTSRHPTIFGNTGQLNI
jgi:hypothetical protein